MRADFLSNLEAVHVLSARNLEDKTNRLRSFRERTGARAVQDFTATRIEKFFVRGKVKDPKEPLSLQTKKNDRVALHAFGVYLMGKGYIDRNPVAAVKAPKPHWRAPSVFLPEQVEALMQAALHDADSTGAFVPWFAICLFAGLRPQADVGNLVVGENVILSSDPALREIRVFRKKTAWCCPASRADSGQSL